MSATRTKRTLAVALLLLPLGLVGCGIEMPDALSDKPKGPSPEEAAARSRERVQAYLDAMIAKDVDAGRSQLCAPLHASFDAGATSPNGDFADHFTVSEAVITDVRPSPRGEQVNTTITVTVAGKAITRPLLFTVTQSGADWCISGEEPGKVPADPDLATPVPSSGAEDAPSPSPAP